jgi:hypothetical protein
MRRAAILRKGWLSFPTKAIFSARLSLSKRRSLLPTAVKKRTASRHAQGERMLVGKPLFDVRTQKRRQPVRLAAF